MASRFEEDVWTLVSHIPSGCVASYGQLALLCGHPEWSRRAGRALRNAPPGLPCHRVVNHAGRTAPGWPEQRMLLQAEGVQFRENGCVAMRQHRWRPE